MALVSIMGGAEIDLASGKEVRDASESLARRLMPQPKPKAIRKRLSTSGVMPAVGPLLLNLNGPPPGAVWTITNVVVFGSDGHTAVAAATAEVYVGGEGKTDAILGNLLAPGFAVPGAVSWGKDTIYAHTGDDLYVLVFGAAALTNLGANCFVHEWYPGAKEEVDYI